MNGGVAILLERMKTHPEEFFNHGSRWNNLIMDFERSLDPAEYKLLEEGIAKCRQEEFTQKVMGKLIGEEREDREVLNTGAVSGSVTLTNSGAGTRYSWTSPTITIPPTK